ncbi:F-box protein At5g52880 isoform X4 [Salvia hispanica]|uniref:F-box protein At5g52880 isoform X4 n=1 Tax=Salvia hispanica TaxID=49212 RepID=UPI0020093646|nr:F-box protein At5g52880 isoform X4 [Salvia hispanica]
MPTLSSPKIFNRSFFRIQFSLSAFSPRCRRSQQFQLLILFCKVRNLLCRGKREHWLSRNTSMQLLQVRENPRQIKKKIVFELSPCVPVIDQLPQDVLVHIFGFLDVKSLLSASAVCRSWNGAAGDNCLWKLLYDTYFSNCENIVKNKGLETVGTSKNEMRQIESITSFGVNYRFAFEAAYKDEKLGCCTGYCSSCHSIVWLNRNRCSNQTGRRNEVEHQIMPISIEKIDDFILNGFVSSESSSDSDSDTDDEFALRLWAYPRQY